jgi:xylulokinase
MFVLWYLDNAIKRLSKEWTYYSNCTYLVVRKGVFLTMTELILGIDIGTGGCKTTLIDTHGNFIADGFSEYITYRPFIGWAEQKAADWFPAFLFAFKSSLEKGGVSAKQIVGLSMSASAHNVVLLDDKNCVIRDTIMWTDQRSAKESEFLKREYGDQIFRIGFQVPAPTWTLPQMLWIKNNEPEVFNRISRIMFIKDYLRYQLTGEWVTDHIEAQGSLLFDNTNWRWAPELCSLAGISTVLLPPVVKPTDIVGSITAEASALTGIPIGVPVVNGAPDTALEHYCVGAIEEGCCVVKIATASTVSIFRNEAYPHEAVLTYSQVPDGLWSTCLATSSAAASLRWYRDAFCGLELHQENNGGKDVYQLLDEEAEDIAPGSSGLIFHPYLMGERSPHWDSKLRGSFVGITAHHVRGHFSRAILEGVAYSIKDNFVIAQQMQPVRQISLVGGGAKSPLWRSIIANVLGKPIIKYYKDDSSFGAAMLAGVGIGVFSSHQDAISKCTREAERTYPSLDTTEAYKNGFKLYREIHNKLKDSYKNYESS